MSQKRFVEKWPKIPELEGPFGVACTLQSEWAANEEGYRAKLYALLATAAHVAVQFDRDPAEWRMFVDHPFWNGQKHRPRPIKVVRSKLKYVVEFMTKAVTRNEKRRTWKFCRGLRFLLDSGTPIEKIPTKIANFGGTEALCRLAARKDPRRPRGDGDDGDDDYICGRGKYALSGEDDKPLRDASDDNELSSEEAQPRTTRSKERSDDDRVTSE